MPIFQALPFGHADAGRSCRCIPECPARRQRRSARGPLQAKAGSGRAPKRCVFDRAGAPAVLGCAIAERKPAFLGYREASILILPAGLPPAASHRTKCPIPPWVADFVKPRKTSEIPNRRVCKLGKSRSFYQGKPVPDWAPGAVSTRWLSVTGSRVEKKRGSAGAAGVSGRSKRAGLLRAAFRRAMAPPGWSWRIGFQLPAGR